MQNNANQSQKTLKNTKLFRPLVASSLALAFSASIASAAPCGSGNAPQICRNGAQLTPNDFRLNTYREYFIPEYTGSSTASTPIAIEGLDFRFDSQGDSAPSTTWDDATKTYSFFAPNRIDAQRFVIDGRDRGLMLGANGTGTLSIYFGHQENARELHLKLDQVRGDFSYKGDILISSGEEKSDGRREDVKFTALKTIRESTLILKEALVERLLQTINLTLV